MKERIFMDLTAEKRKMPRMQVDLSASIIWGIANDQSEINVCDLSIHGISFRAAKYFTRGTKFKLIFPNAGKKTVVNNIQAEVVRCKTLSGISSGGHFEVGAKFSFKARRKIDTKDKPIVQALAPLQPNDSDHPLVTINTERLIKPNPPGNAMGARVSSTPGVCMTEINAEFIHSVKTPTKEETVITRIQIKQARLTATSLSSQTGLKTGPGNNSQKFISPEFNNQEGLILKPN
jgi:hypothetical protein